MRRGHRFAWVMIVLGFAGATALGQQGGNGGQGGGGQGGGGQGGGGQGGGGQGGGGQGGQGGMSTGTPLIQLEQAPTISAPGSSTTGGGTGSGGADTSNFLSATYGNPYYQGLMSNAKSGAAPGGFGTPLFGTTTGGAGGRGGAGGALGGRGGVGARGIGGLGGRGLGGGQDGVLVQLPVSISYPAIATFPVAPIPTSQLQTDIAAMVARTRELANPAGVTVSVQNGIVTLTGAVKDMDEAKTIASMIRMSPGVRSVKNDLTVAKP